MGRRQPSEPDFRCAEAIARVGLAKIAPQLLRYLTNTLHLPPRDALRAGPVEADEVLDTLIEQAWAGEGGWPLPDDAPEAVVIAALRGKAFWIAWGLHRKRRRGASDDDLDGLAHQGPDAAWMLEQHRLIAEVRETFKDDPEASAYLEKMFEGSERAEIARELGCTGGRVDVVRNRIVYGMRARWTKKDESAA